jgi:hypothetical protein
LIVRDPPFDCHPVTVLRVWRERSNTDLASVLLRGVIRDACERCDRRS